MNPSWCGVLLRRFGLENPALRSPLFIFVASSPTVLTTSFFLHTFSYHTSLRLLPVLQHTAVSPYSWFHSNANAGFLALRNDRPSFLVVGSHSPTWLTVVINMVHSLPLLAASSFHCYRPGNPTAVPAFSSWHSLVLPWLRSYSL